MNLQESLGVESLSFFNITYTDASGSTRVVRVNAEKESVATAPYMSAGCSVVRCVKENPGVSLVRVLYDQRPIKSSDVVFAMRQLAVLLRSGISLVMSLDILIAQSPHPRLKRTFEQVRDEVASGTTLSEALRVHDIFTTLTINMVRGGEESGKLDEVLDDVSQASMKDLELRGKVKSALTYPAVILAISVIVVIVLLTYILPKFIDVFKSSEMELPLPTVILLFVSDLLQNWWWAGLGALGLGGFLFVRYARTRVGRRHLDALKLRIPILGRLFLLTSMARFARTFAALSSSGVAVVQSLQAAQSVTGNTLLSEIIAEATEEVVNGAELSASLEKHALIPNVMVQMIASGEKSGALPEMLNELAGFYEVETEHTLGSVVSLFEPMTLVVMATIIGGIALAVLMPMFNLVNSYR